MPDISDKIDKISKKISDKGLVAQEEITKALMELTKGITAEEAAIMLAGINIKELMISKLTNAYSEFQSGAIALLESTFTTAPLSEAALQAALDNSLSFLSEKFIDGTTTSIRQNIVSGITGNKTPSQVIADMRKAGFEPHHLKTQVETGFNQYSNSVKTQMADKLPDKAIFVYIGANDTLTRDECAERISLSPATKEFILDKWGGFDNAGWNCRHTWEEQMDDVEAQGFESKKTNA